MERISIICFLASYVLALAGELTRLRGWFLSSRLATLAITMAGLFAHTVYLWNRAQQTNLPPLLSSLHDWMLVLAWLVVLVYLFVTLLDRELAIGFLAWPVTVGLIIAAYLMPSTGGDMAVAHRNWAMLHVSLLIFGIAGVVLGFVVSLMYLWQHHRMKHHQAVHSGLALPSLERLARWNRWLLLASVPLLTFGMVIGIGLTIVRQSQATERVSWLDPLVVVSGVCWLIMSALFVWLLAKKRPPGRQIAWLTAWACGFMLLTTVGSQWLVRVTHWPGVHGTSGRLRPAEPHAPHTASPPRSLPLPPGTTETPR